MKRLSLMLLLFLAGCDGEAEKTLKVKKSDITLAITTTGELASARTIELGPPTVKYTW